MRGGPGVGYRLGLVLGLVVVLTGIVLTDPSTRAAALSLTPHDPILIQSDADFTAANGVVGGAGTRANPYRIEGWDITPVGGPGIAIRNTAAFFEVRDLRVADPDRSYDGVVLENLTNGAVEAVEVAGAFHAVVLTDVSSSVVGNTTISNAFRGVSVSSGASLTLTGNAVQGIFGPALSFEGSRSVWIEGNTLTGDDAGIWSTRTSGFLLQANHFERLGESAKFWDSDNLTVQANVFVDSQSALWLVRTRNATVDGNAFTNAGVVLEGDQSDDYASHAFTANTVNGRELRYVRGCTDLVVDGESLGQLIVADCTRVRVANLSLARTAVGIELAFVRDAVVEGNDVTTGVWGIALHHVSGAVVRGNTLWDQWGGSLMLDISDGVVVYRNNLVNSAPPSDAGGQGNAWNATLPDGGNYWPLYMGRDLCGGVAQDVCGLGDGFGDVPYAPAAGIVDHYPRTAPFGLDGRKPTASITFSRTRLPAGEGFIVYSDGSTDPQGTTLLAMWDFGDGTIGTSTTEFHAYQARGNYTVTLKVTDGEGLSDIVSGWVVVTALPVARFTASRTLVVVGDAVSFDASASSSEDTYIVSYTWDFGDGSEDAGPVVSHAYTSPGDYTVLLVVYDADNAEGGATTRISVVAPIELVSYNHPAGFRLDIPSGWSVLTNQSVGDSIVELVVLDPDDPTFATNILVDTDRDPTVFETHDYLSGIVAGTVNDIRSDDPGAHVIEVPTYRSIAGHAGVVFAIQYASQPVIQKMAIVVSEDHGRYWILLLTTSPSLYVLWNESFNAIVDSFEITLAPPPQTGSTPMASAGFFLILFAVGVAAIALVLAVVVIVVVTRQKRRTSAPPMMYGPAPTPVFPRTCAACGSPNPPDDSFCSRCGTPLR